MFHSGTIRRDSMTRLLIILGLAFGLGGCIVAPPYGYAPGYGYAYAPGYYAAPTVDVGVGFGGYYGHGWHGR
jgi:hypothetical protein